MPHRNRAVGTPRPAYGVSIFWGAIAPALRFLCAVTPFRPALILALALAILLAPVLLATSVVAPTFPELVAESSIIARVEVTAIRPAWVETSQGRVIKTFVTFRILRVLKNTAASPAPAELTLPFLGGELDGEGMRVQGMPRFTVGQTDILFISDATGAHFSPLVGLMHGRYRVLTDPATARTYLARNDGTPLENEADVQLPQSATSPANRLKSIARALSPEAFETRISTESARAAALP